MDIMDYKIIRLVISQEYLTIIGLAEMNASKLDVGGLIHKQFIYKNPLGRGKIRLNSLFVEFFR